MKDKLKKDYLTKEEIDTIIIAAMNSLRKDENLIEGLNFNYLAMEHSFFDSLGIFCIKDFNDEERDKLYNEGLLDEFIDSVKNARYAYNLLHTIADKSVNNIEGVINKLFGDITNSNTNLEDLQEALPQLQEVFQKYDNIVNGNAEETK